MVQVASKRKDELQTVDQVTLRRRGTGLIAHDPWRAGEGFTLIAPQTDGGNVYLIAMDGSVAHQWKMPCRPGRHAVLLDNGNLGYNGNLPNSPDIYPAWMLWHGGAIYEATPDGTIVWEYTDPARHHDAQWLPNGNLLYGALEPMPKEFAARVIGGSAKHDLADGTIYGDVIKEVNRKGEIVWLWRAWEHLRPEDFPIHPIFDRYHWPLINGLAQTRAGLVLMSLRTTSGVIAVNKQTGDVAFHIPHDIVAQQHTPSELDNGNILIFDNGNLRPGVTSPSSRVIEVDPKTNTVVWEISTRCGRRFSRPIWARRSGCERQYSYHQIRHRTPVRRHAPRRGRVGIRHSLLRRIRGSAGAPLTPSVHNSVFRSYRYQRAQIPWL